jgi:stress-induced morphogen
VARHRLVYDCVADWMPHRIHALSLTATTPPIRDV